MTWDQVRAASKGRRAPLPKCSRCGRPRVFDPCRACGTEEELAAQGAPAAPIEPPRPAGETRVAAARETLRATKGVRL